MSHRNMLSVAAATSFLLLAACNRPEGTAATPEESIDEILKGQKEIRDADKNTPPQGGVADGRQLALDVAGDQYETDIAAADSAYAVAKEKCDAAKAASEDACRAQARADHEASLAQARSRLDAAGP